MKVLFEQDETRLSPILTSHCFYLGDTNPRDLRDAVRLHRFYGTHPTPVFVVLLLLFGHLCIPFFSYFTAYFYNVESVNLKIIMNGHRFSVLSWVFVFHTVYTV